MLETDASITVWSYESRKNRIDDRYFISTCYILHISIRCVHHVSNSLFVVSIK